MTLNLELLETKYQLLKANAELENTIKSQRNALCEAFIPTLTDFSHLPAIISALEQTLCECDRATRTRIELLILLYLYCPVMLFYNSKKRGYNKEFRQVVRALSLQYSNALKYRSSLLFFYRRYPHFRTLTNTAFAALSDSNIPFVMHTSGALPPLPHDLQ